MTALNCDLISQSVSEDTKHAAVSTDLCEFGNEAHLHTKGPSLHPMYVTYFKYVPNQVFGSFLKRKNTLVSSATPKDREDHGKQLWWMTEEEKTLHDS